MARLPNIKRFRGDNKQSFSEWIHIFIAQLEVLDIDEEKFKQTLLCFVWKQSIYIRFSVYGIPQQCNFCRYEKDYDGRILWRRLQTKVGNKTANNIVHRRIKYTTFSLELKKLIKELYSIEDNKTKKLITSNHVVANLEPLFKETMQILQLSGNTRLESLLELIKSKMDHM